MQPAAIPPPFDSPDQALAWAEQLVTDVEAARSACNVILPSQGELLARDQRRLERVYLVRHGVALGALAALRQCRMISDIAYNGLVERVHGSLMSTVVGSKS